MTARKPTDSSSDNCGVTRDVEAQTILEDVRQREGATVRTRSTDEVATDGGVIQSLMNAVSGEQPSVDLTEQELYETLSNDRRRRMIRLFAGLYADDELTFIAVGDLAETLAQYEKDGDQPISSADRQRHYIGLIQTHLPELDADGLIEYFERPKKLRVNESAVVVADIMASISEVCDGTEDDPTPLTELGPEEVERDDRGA